MSTEIATKTEALEELLIKGNLAVLSPEQRTDYYRRLCENLDLNPLTQPFEYMTLNGKLVLYLKRAGAEQLAERRGIGIKFISDGVANDIYTYRVEASTPDGRTAPGIGAVNVTNLKGDALCNAMMKAETKACRRATIRICGLGILDESEAHDIPGVRPIAAQPEPPRALPPQGPDPELAKLQHKLELCKTLKELRAFWDDEVPYEYQMQLADRKNALKAELPA